MNHNKPQYLALHSAEIPKNLGLALCTEIAAGDEPPQWVELIPPGQTIKGQDGRTFTNGNPGAVVAAFNNPFPIDVNHASHLKAPKGEDSRAFGWIEALEQRDGGAIWGKVEWTPEGKTSLQSRAYRYLSPGLLHTGANRQIQKIVSVGLTNTPNLTLAALNAAQSTEDDPMNEEQWKALLKKLGLAEDATPEMAMNAVGKLESDKTLALNAVKEAEAKGGNLPDLNQYVPRADLELATNRAVTAENKLAESAKAVKDEAVELAINSAIEAGKIAPTSKDFYVDTCQAEGGLEQFQKFIEGAPNIVPNSGLDNKKPEGEGVSLNSEQLAVCTAMGLDPEEYRKTLSV